MEFRVTEIFVESYEALEDVDAMAVDEVIMRVIDEHDRAWARQNRVVGEEGEAWIVLGRSKRSEFKVYWMYQEEDVILFLALLFT